MFILHINNFCKPLRKRVTSEQKTKLRENFNKNLVQTVKTRTVNQSKLKCSDGNNHKT